MTEYTHPGTIRLPFSPDYNGPFQVYAPEPGWPQLEYTTSIRQPGEVRQQVIFGQLRAEYEWFIEQGIAALTDTQIEQQSVLVLELYRYAQNPGKYGVTQAEQDWANAGLKDFYRDIRFGLPAVFNLTRHELRTGQIRLALWDETTRPEKRDALQAELDQRMANYQEYLNGK